VPGRTRIALIVDNLRVARWQAEALVQIADDVEVLLLNCTNTRFTRKPLRHALYYLLNIVSLKTRATASTPLPVVLKVVDQMNFEAEADGGWQRLPLLVLNKLEQWQPAAAIKFGMGLLRVPESPKCKILSYHHGDPRRFRGRPGGFYELQGREATVGQMVQVISNRLDAGELVAFAETCVAPHSYRSTMADAYRTSPLLMKKALRNCLAGTSLPIEPVGKNYRLPSNGMVARFAGNLGLEKARRLLYGAFIHKAWEVASVDAAAETLDQLIEATRESSNWRVIPRPRRYQFLADPFPHPSEGVLVEALRKSDGQGEIVHFDRDEERILCSGRGHFSYPTTIRIADEWFMLPEVSEWATPKIYRLRGEVCEHCGDLDIDGQPRLADATLFADGSGVYLFANHASEGSGVLRLWTADSISSQFTEHPKSPVCISPAGGRMAGALLELDGRLYRLGQDCSRGYGRRIIVFEILELSGSGYREERTRQLSLPGLMGPHTLNVRGNTAYFDFYRERFSPFAGVQRLRAAMSKRRALSRLASSQAVIGCR
jgi:hypothetical protein